MRPVRGVWTGGTVCDSLDLYFSDPQRLVAYLGLNPSMRQSGEGQRPIMGA
ncbi:transposase [Paramesorhizobium deserti]|uniref:transposase n=1 Tax=Paramesorhizobium deserti TaxID=1494590 RepID=UPI003CC79CB8